MKGETLERVRLGMGKLGIALIKLGLHFNYPTIAITWKMELTRMRLEGMQVRHHGKTPGKSS